MKDELMISLIVQRNNTLLMQVINEHGLVVGKERHYKMSEVMKALSDAESIMQAQNVEYGIRPVGFIKNSHFNK